jgi:hypothetical protein
LKQAVFAGDKFVTEITDVLVAAEVPVKSFQGSGKADLVVFVRRRVADAVVWTPVMVLDIKTKAGISWKMLGRMPRTKREDTRVPYHAIRKRRLTDSEWASIIEGTPSNRDIEQLMSYEQGLVLAYKTLVTNDSSAPDELWKGIVVLDTDQDREMKERVRRISLDLESYLLHLKDLIVFSRAQFRSIHLKRRTHSKREKGTTDTSHYTSQLHR